MNRVNRQTWTRAYGASHLGTCYTCGLVISRSSFHVLQADKPIPCCQYCKSLDHMHILDIRNLRSDTPGYRLDPEGDTIMVENHRPHRPIIHTPIYLKRTRQKI